MTDLSRISLPTAVKNFVFQFEFLLQVLSIRVWKDLILALPTMASNPKYFSKEPFTLTPTIIVMFCLMLGGVFLLKNIEVFLY